MGRLQGKRKKHSKYFYPICFGCIFFVGFLLLYILPFFNSVFITFFDLNSGGFVGIQNYVGVFTSETFALAARNTLKFALIGVPLNIALALVTAVILCKLTSRSKIFRSIFVLPLMVPALSVAMTFQIIFSGYGIANVLLNYIKVQPIDFFNSGYAFFVLVAIYIWKSVGYSVILFLSGLNMIPHSIVEAGEIDGASNIRILISIKIPLLRPTLIFTLIMSIMNLFKSFRELYEVFGETPHESIYMLQHFLNNNFGNLNYTRMTITSVAIFIFMLIFTIALLVMNKKGGASCYEE